MNIYFSPSFLGFYRDDIHAVMPKDAKKISKKTYEELSGKSIEADSDGMPVLKKQVQATKEQIQTQIEMLNAQVQSLTEKLNAND